MNRWAVLFLAMLTACGGPEKPVTRQELLVSGRPLADSIAASYGLVAGFGEGTMESPDNLLTRWPVGAGWISLMPGRLPGLRAWWR